MGTLRAIPGCYGLGFWMPESLAYLYRKAFSISQLIRSNVSSEKRLTGFLMRAFLPLLGVIIEEGFSHLYSFKSNNVFVSPTHNKNVSETLER